MKKILIFILGMFFLSKGFGCANNSDTLYAFTHPKFFYSSQCECSRFNFDYVYLFLYDTNARYGIRTIIPANFDVGHEVIIVGKVGEYFRIKFRAIAPGDYEQDLDGKEFCVAKGDLGTWLYNYEKKTGRNIDIPLYETASYDSKIISFVDSKNNVAIILDVKDNWMFVETIGENGGKKGWLSPANQCGNPYGPSEEG